jgi:hypothetical protein
MYTRESNIMQIFLIEHEHIYVRTVRVGKRSCSRTHELYARSGGQIYM